MRRSRPIGQRGPLTVSRYPPPPPSRDVASQGGGGSVAGLALSSRSTVTTVKRCRTTTEAEVTLPYTLFEFGFPSDDPPPLPVSEQFTDEGGELFMRSEAGTQLRRLESTYNSYVRQYLIRSVRLARARVLVLGSGSSREIIPLLNRGVESVVFVDVSQAALTRLERNLRDAGVLGPVDAEFVCMDAWEYLLTAPEEEFHLVLAMKCIGLVLGLDPARRTAPEFIEMCASTLRSDGSLMADEHVAFSGADVVGRRVVDVVDPELSDLATIGGRYAADVCYSVSGGCGVLDYVGHLSSPVVEHGVQVWRMYHFRLSCRRVPPRVVLSGRRPLNPVPMRATDQHPYDSVSDALYPVNARGVKRVLVPSDCATHDMSRARCKFDGIGGVVALSGNSGIFISGTESFAIPLSHTVTPPLVLSAERVLAKEGGAVVVITGVLAVDGAPADPLDFTTLDAIRPVLDSLVVDGFLVSTPELTRMIRGNDVVMARGPSVVTLPVDGIQLHIDGTDGVFVKPHGRCTVDADVGEVESLVRTALESMGYDHSSLAIAKAPTAGIWEYGPVGDAWGEWRPLRVRSDKVKSDPVGSVIHTLWSVVWWRELGVEETVEGVFKKLMN